MRPFEWQPLDEIAPDLAAFASNRRRLISEWEPRPCPLSDVRQPARRKCWS